jgi:hypothetical protein
MGVQGLVLNSQNSGLRPGQGRRRRCPRRSGPRWRAAWARPPALARGSSTWMRRTGTGASTCQRCRLLSREFSTVSFACVYPCRRASHSSRPAMSRLVLPPGRRLPARAGDARRSQGRLGYAVPVKLSTRESRSAARQSAPSYQADPVRRRAWGRLLALLARDRPGEPVFRGAAGRGPRRHSALPPTRRLAMFSRVHYSGVGWNGSVALAYDAFGATGTTFRERECKPPVFFERAVNAWYYVFGLIWLLNICFE